MIVTDKNQTLKPPEDCVLVSLSAQGDFLRLEYVNAKGDGGKSIHHTRIYLYLNDLGREVLRTEEVWTESIPVPEPSPAPLTFWQKVWEFLDGIPL